MSTSANSTPLTQRLISLMLALLLPACAYQPPAGQWNNLNAQSLVFNGVKITPQTLDSGYPDICREAQSEIENQLIRQLPERLLPLTFSTPVASPDSVLLSIQIKQCRVDAQQWDGGTNGLVFTYYLTLKLHISLQHKNQKILSYDVNTQEQIDTDTSGPAFEFTFEEAIQRTLLLFKGGQVLIPD